MPAVHWLGPRPMVEPAVDLGPLNAPQPAIRINIPESASHRVMRAIDVRIESIIRSASSAVGKWKLNGFVVKAIYPVCRRKSTDISLLINCPRRGARL